MTASAFDYNISGWNTYGDICIQMSGDNIAQSVRVTTNDVQQGKPVFQNTPTGVSGTVLRFKTLNRQNLALYLYFDGDTQTLRFAEHEWSDGDTESTEQAAAEVKNYRKILRRARLISILQVSAGSFGEMQSASSQKQAA